MEVRVADLKKWAGREETVAFHQAPWPDLQERLAGRAAGPVDVQARVRHTGGSSILVEVDGVAVVADECARCLEPTVAVVRFADAQEYRPVIPGDDDDWLLYANDVVELDAWVADAVAVAVPLVSLCRADCKGLCPVCGADWNRGSCGCEPGPDARWAALSTLVSKDEGGN
jgi:uncharacterized protein